MAEKFNTKLKAKVLYQFAGGYSKAYISNDAGVSIDTVTAWTLGEGYEPNFVMRSKWLENSPSKQGLWRY